MAIGSAVPERVTASVPDVVIGEPDTDRNAGTDIATEDTEPEPVPTAAPLTKRPVALIVPAPCTPPVADPTTVPVVGLSVRLPVGLSDVISVLAPEAAAPIPDRAVACVVPPVPPLAIGNVPVTLAVRLQ